MPKSYELKIREAEERRRPRAKEELYKAVEGQPQRILLGFDHPETLQLEMQLTWVEDTFTVDETHDHIMSEVRRLDAEYRRKPLRCDYSQKHVWWDRHVMRPRVRGHDLVLQDFGFEPGYHVKVTGGYTMETMWGEPVVWQPHLQRRADQMDPQVDEELLVRLDKGGASTRARIVCFPWLGGQSSAYIPLAQRMPKDVALYAIEPPGKGERESAEGYPTGEFLIEVMAKTLAKEMKKPGNTYFFAHSQGSSFAYYVAKLLSREFNVRTKGLFVSSFAVPAAYPTVDVSTQRARHNLCIPLRIFTGLVKQGWGTDPKLGYKSHMGPMAYQSVDLWPAARNVLTDWWITKDFPLPGADEPLDVPIAAFHGEDDLAVSRADVEEWKGVTSFPGKFELISMDGNHLWFSTSSKNCELLAEELVRLVRKFE